jgi:hypothetical protein
MMPTLQLTHDAAARIYDGPRFHRIRTASEQRRIIRDNIRQLKRNPSIVMRYAGHVLEAIANINPKELAPRRS